MRYTPLFELAVAHGYYPDGQCPDFALVPTPATAARLANHRLLFRPRPHGASVLTPLTAQQAPLLDPRPGATFRFEMRLQNPAFYLFTDLTAQAARPAPVYTNVGAGASGLALHFRQPRHTEHLVLTRPAAETPFTLRGRPLREAEPAQFTMSGGASVRRYDAGANRLLVDTSALAAGAALSVSYPVPARPDAGVFAEIEIVYDAAQPRPPEEAPVFEVRFAPKQAHWRYYLVTSTPPAGSGYRLSHVVPSNGGPAALAFGDPVDVRQQAPPGDAVAARLAARYPDASVHLLAFTSEAAVACRKAARTGIRLSLDGHEVIRHVPNPSLDQFAVEPAAPEASGGTQDVLFHIIRRIRPPLLTSTP